MGTRARATADASILSPARLGDVAARLRLREVLGGLLFLIAYCLLDRIALLLPPDTGGVTPWTLSAGLALALFLRAGPRAAPILFAAELVSSLLTPTPPLPLAGALASAVVVTLSYGLVGSALRHAIDPRLERQGDLVRLLVGALIAGMLAAALNALVLATWAGVDLERAPDTIYRGWIANVLGQCLMTPALLVLRLRWPRGDLRRWAERGLQAALLLTCVALVFAVEPGNRVRIYYLLFLPQIWIAARGGVGAVVLSNLIVQAGVLVSLINNPRAADLIFEFQFRLLALILSGLFLAVAVAERRTAQAALIERQEALARVSRLSAAGEMAAALAHELNQPLAAVVAFANAARRLASPETSADPKFATAIEGAVSQAERAGAIVQSLRQFIARGEPVRRRQRPQELLADAAGLMEAEARRAGARIVISTDRGLPAVQVDRVQIQQVLVNLLQNGVNAVAGGADAIRQVSLSAWTSSEGAVEFEVGDTGPGVPVEVASRLFSAFPGGGAGGLGLGLMICRGVVEAHGGRIWLDENRPGHCTVRFTLPVAGRSYGSTPP
jgi:two-component system sensor kinase FixL